VTPAIISLTYLLYFRKNVRLHTLSKVLIGSFLALIIPLILISVSGNGFGRFNQVISTPNLGMVLQINENRGICVTKLPKLICYLNSNKPLAYVQTGIFRYLKTFSPNYLFLEGESDWKIVNVENYGLFFLILFPFYVAAIIRFWNRIFSKKRVQDELFVLGGLLITTLPALIVSEPQKSRLLPMFPFMIILLTHGMDYCQSLLNRLKETTFYWLITLSLLVSFSIYSFNLFFIHFYKNEFHYQNHVVKLVRYLGTLPKENEIYIRGIDEGIIYYAFVNKVDPHYYQTNVKREPRDEIGFSHATDLGNIHLTTKDLTGIYCQTRKTQKPVIYVTNQNYLDTGEFKRIDKVIYSENKALKYLFVYNLKNLVNPKPNCQPIKK
jgi:hypothetical protein